MPRFGQRSQIQLDSSHPDIQRICNVVIKIFDFSAICGHRGKESQQIAFKSKKSKLQFPDSKHNKKPSMALDVAPYPINWNKKSEFIYLAGHMKMAAQILYDKGEITHVLRSGNDWDNDNDLSDQKFMDIGHLELIKPE